MPSSSPDLILRISLILSDSTLKEFNPPIWRTFKVSSSTNLDLLHDKIIAPIMGWERNYHMYFFRGVEDGDVVGCDDNTTAIAEMNCTTYDDGEGGCRKCAIHLSGDEFHGPKEARFKQRVHYVQKNSTAFDEMFVDKFVESEFIRDAASATIGDLLKEVGDRCIYNYDLGDCWYHCLEVKQVLPADSGGDDDDEHETADGAVVLYDGAMRCPDEDGEGCAMYQEEILDLLLLLNKEKSDDNAREFAHRCFHRRHALNVMGPFRPKEFNLLERRQTLANALQSRNSSKITKFFTQGGQQPCVPAPVGIGQKQIIYRKEDDRCEGTPGFMTVVETINVKPDPKDKTLCYTCGTPHNLKACSRCQSAFYCTRNCQSKHWDVAHKQKCKSEKIAYDKYCKEVRTNTPDPNRMNNTVQDHLYRKYIDGNLRFRIGDFVECMIGDNEWGTGRVIKLYHRESSWPESRPPVPYQVKLDQETANRLGISWQQAFIYSDWDDDYLVRRSEKGAKKKRLGKKGRNGSRRK